MRLCAFFSKDKSLLEIFNSADDYSADVYSIMATKLFKAEKVTKELRSQAKQLTLAILYGIFISFDFFLI